MVLSTTLIDLVLKIPIAGENPKWKEFPLRYENLVADISLELMNEMANLGSPAAEYGNCPM